mgnify:CR=1 FL=1
MPSNEAWACAGAWKPCELCGGRGVVRDVPEDPETLEVACSNCNGTGRSYVLQGVRVPCSLTLRPLTGAEIVCPSCHGLGYTPAESLETWLEAIEVVYGPISIVGSEDGWEVVVTKGHAQGDNGLRPTLLAALKQALAAQGATLGEVSAMINLDPDKEE